MTNVGAINTTASSATQLLQQATQTNAIQKKDSDKDGTATPTPPPTATPTVNANGQLIGQVINTTA